MTTYPNDQGNPAGAIPVQLVYSGAFYQAGGGGGSTPVAPYQSTKLGYQQIASTSALQTLTVPTGATFCLVSVEGADARWTDDGTTPTTTTGMPIYAGTTIQFSGSLNALQFIAQAAGPCTYNISYYH